MIKKGGCYIMAKTENKTKKKLSLWVVILSIGFLLIVGGGLLLSGLFSGTSSQKLADASEHSLEQYVLETYAGEEGLNDIVFGFTNIEDDVDLAITDFSLADGHIDPYDLENFAGTVEFDEVNHVYHFANGNVSDDAPRIDEFTRRVPILRGDVHDLPDIYENIFYNKSGVVDVDSSYFKGSSEYVTLQIFDQNYETVRTIRYVQPDTYPYILAELSASVADDYEISEITIGEEEYLRYDVVQPVK